MTKATTKGAYNRRRLKCRICTSRLEPKGDMRPCRTCGALACDDHRLLGQCHRCAGIELPDECRSGRVALRKGRGGGWIIVDPQKMDDGRTVKAQPWEVWVALARRILERNEETEWNT